MVGGVLSCVLLARPFDGDADAGISQAMCQKGAHCGGRTYSSRTDAPEGESSIARAGE